MIQKRLVFSVIILFVFALFYTWIEQAEARRMGGGDLWKQPELPAERSQSDLPSEKPEPDATFTTVPCDTGGGSKAIRRNARRTPHGWTHRLPSLWGHAQLGRSGASGYYHHRRASLFHFPVSQGKANGDSGRRADILQHRTRFSRNLGFSQPRTRICSGSAAPGCGRGS